MPLVGTKQQSWLRYSEVPLGLREDSEPSEDSESVTPTSESVLLAELCQIIAGDEFRVTGRLRVAALP
jgi:hypothetical protein